jgi:hypothetical protein
MAAPAKAAKPGGDRLAAQMDYARLIQYDGARGRMALIL